MIKTGTLLIASPELLDPHFRRAVVLILEHDAEGTVGIVLNHPSKISCRQIMKQFNLEWHDPHPHLYIGGPVNPRSLWLLHSEGWSFEHTAVMKRLSVSRSEEALSALCHAREQRMIVCVGYSGWGGGQLERELAEGSWWTVEGDADFIFETGVKDMWEEALSLLGVDADALILGGQTVH